MVGDQTLSTVVQSWLLPVMGESVSRLQRQEVASLQATRVCLLHLALGGWILHARWWAVARPPQQMTWHMSGGVELGVGLVFGGTTGGVRYWVSTSRALFRRFSLIHEDW